VAMDDITSAIESQGRSAETRCCQRRGRSMAWYTRRDPQLDSSDMAQILLRRDTERCFVLCSVDVVGRSVERDDPSGNADDDSVIGYIRGDDGIRPNCHVIAHFDRTNHLRTRCDVDVVSNYRSSLVLSAIDRPNRHSLADVAVLPYDG